MPPWKEIEERAGRPRYVVTAGFALSLLFAVFGPYVKYSPVGALDPWIYTGYFTNFRYVNWFHGGRYYFSRLPWTLPGLLAFQLATPAAASILLNAAILAASVIALYYAVCWHYGTAPALVTALALLVNPYFNSAVGWDYPDGPAIAYGFVAAAFAVRPHGRRAVNTILMAVFLALSGFTNMSGAPMILGILVFPLWRQRGSMVELAREAGHIAAGVVGTGLALMPVSKAVLGYWLFFMQQIELARWEMGSHPEYLTNMWGSGSGFLLKAYRLFPPAFLLVFGLAVLLLARQRKAIAWPSYFALVVCCGLYGVQEFGLHGVALRVPYHCVYLVVPLFLLAGVVLGELWQRVIWRHEWYGPAVGALVLTLPWLYDAWRFELFIADLWTDLAIASVVAFALLAAWRGQPGVFRVPLALVMAGILFAGPARELSVLLSMQKNNPDEFEALMSLQTLLKSTSPADREALFWTDRGELHDNLFTSAAALWVWGTADFTKYITDSSAQELRLRFSKGPMLVHLTDHPEKIGERLKLLDARGVKYGNPREWTVRVGGTQFYVAAEDVTTDIWGIH